MTHTHSPCPRASRRDGPANCCYLLLQTPCGETKLEGGRGKNEVCVCVWLNDLKQRVGHKSFEVRQTNMCRYMSLFFVSRHSLPGCFCVCVCVQSGGFGTVARQGDHFQPAGDLTLICSMLMTAAGLGPQRAEQTWLN